MSKSLSLSPSLPPTGQLKLLHSQKKSSRTSSPSSSPLLLLFVSLLSNSSSTHTRTHTLAAVAFLSCYPTYLSLISLLLYCVIKTQRHRHGCGRVVSLPPCTRWQLLPCLAQTTHIVAVGAAWHSAASSVYNFLCAWQRDRTRLELILHSWEPCQRNSTDLELETHSDSLCFGICAAVLGGKIVFSYSL